MVQKSLMWENNLSLFVQTLHSVFTFKAFSIVLIGPTYYIDMYMCVCGLCAYSRYGSSIFTVDRIFHTDKWTILYLYSVHPCYGVHCVYTYRRIDLRYYCRIVSWGVPTLYPCSGKQYPRVMNGVWNTQISRAQTIVNKSCR